MMICAVKNNKTFFKKREKEKGRERFRCMHCGLVFFSFFFFFFGYVNSLLQHSGSSSWHAHYSSCNAWALRLWFEGLVACSMWDLSSLIRDQTPITLHWKMVSLPENHQ